MTEHYAQYALVDNNRLIQWCWARDVVHASKIFKGGVWPDGSIVINLTELLRTI